MPKEFVKGKVGSVDLTEAVKQQRDLSYFTQSVIQDDVTSTYVENWADRKYATNDMFLNYVKQVFRTDNFIAFFKFMRNPLPSAELINDRIKEPLERVFHSDDSFFKYNIRGEQFHEIDELDSKKFNKDIFNSLLFRHNNIVVTTIKDINTPKREIVDIDNVVAIDSKDSVIRRIAYTFIMNIEGKPRKGFLYIDDKEYIFFSDKFEQLAQVNHDLGSTPADFIAIDPFSDKDSVRKSMFSYVRTALEEYVFLKTLQRMTEPNGPIPVITMLQSKIANDNKDTKGQGKGEPTSNNIMGSQQAELSSEITPSTNLIQAGSVIKVPVRMKEDNSVDTGVAQEFFKFHHMPIEPLKYLNERIEEIEKDIIISLLGNFQEQNDSAKNELQVGLSFVNKEDTLRSFSIELSRIRNLSDFKFLALQHGKDNVQVDCFYGSDFFKETEEQLYDLFEKSPNPIERKNILIRLARNRNRFNKMKMERETLLNMLLPFAADEDFDKAIARNIDEITFEYQNRFTYWINIFEAQYGDILLFANEIEGSNSEKLILINNLIINIITTNTNTDGRKDPASDA